MISIVCGLLPRRVSISHFWTDGAENINQTNVGLEIDLTKNI